MKFNPEKYHRRSIRLKGYDYSQAGLYFITICCQNRECLFGEIKNGKIKLNNAGIVIENIWKEIPSDFSNVCLHKYVIMPNHIHAIIEIFSPVGADSISVQKSYPISIRNNTDSIGIGKVGVNSNRAEMDSAPTGKIGIPQIIQSFKRHTTIQYIKMIKQNILPPFNKRIWQRNYWEHIIRNENEFLRISQYIENNPINWEKDKLNGGERNSVIKSKQNK